MANERLWIYCNYCDEKKLLYKYYPDEDELLSYIWKPEEMELFLDEHIERHLNRSVIFEGMPFRLEK